jgi:hypothetical protein
MWASRSTPSCRRSCVRRSRPAAVAGRDPAGAAAGGTLVFLEHARGFYESCGYTPVGDVYDEVGIPRIAMEKRM